MIYELQGMTNKNSDSSQLKRYAEDLQKIYRSEKKKRAELEEAHRQLKKYAEDLKKTIGHLEVSNKKLIKQVELEEKEKLIERKLIQVNKMTSLGTLASGIAHEINNPISFLLGNSQILMDIWKNGESILLDFKKKGNDIVLGGLSLDDILEHVPKMLKGNFEGTNRINKIISGLKDYSAIPSETELEIIDINKAIRFSITLLERKIKESSSELVTELEENLPGPQGIPQQIEQVIINLLQNSIIAMGTRRGKITISSHYNKKSDCIKIIVKDEGIGIEKKNLSRVTEPFFTTSRAHGGTGLGLYISYSIIKQHEGKIDIDSVRGKGTTITVSIPVRREMK